MKNSIKVAKRGVIISLFTLVISSITLIYSSITGKKIGSEIIIFCSVITILFSNISIYKSIKVNENNSHR
ncbi:hypothetical protein [Clostridium sardiniense]|uniref:hypothetical protein n=1 Tax=Clostridium sardiniense TaxID=29369 RepID=UPI003D336971